MNESSENVPTDHLKTFPKDKAYSSLFGQVQPVFDATMSKLRALKKSKNRKLSKSECLSKY